eukprot:TRINITY_DN584_c0_g1_i2.p1 TRINITY_DN584_c0_g1~~TRINITY_DN584_c0_g1_i2.p1  ORF type:complete len:573 (+),score=127.46 TRINITY_DN584_c0_g1_i2:250-1719(+)
MVNALVLSSSTQPIESSHTLRDAINTPFHKRFRAIISRVKKTRRPTPGEPAITLFLSDTTSLSPSSSGVPFWSLVPDDVIIHILHFLGLRTLCNVVSVLSKRFQQLSLRDDLWLSLYLRKIARYSDAPLSIVRGALGDPRTGAWRVPVRQSLSTERNWKKGKYVERTLEGHTDWIWTLQFKDSMMVTGSDDRTIRVWDLERGKTALTYRGHKEGVRCLQFDRSKSLLLSGSQDKQILMWKLPSDDIMQSISSSASSSNNKRNSRLNINNANNNGTPSDYPELTSPTSSLLGHEGTVTCLQFKDSLLVSGSVDRSIRMWDLPTSKFLYTLEGHKDRVRCLQIHDNNVLISGSGDNTVRVWDLRAANDVQARATLKGHSCTVVSLQAQGHRLVTASSDTTIGVWDLRNTSSMITSYKEHTNYVLCVQFDHDRMVSGSGDKTVKIWDLSQAASQHTLRHHQRLVSCLQFDSRRIITGSFDKTLHMWDFGAKF